ncbi:major facilitator superfamily domain-containing protein [Umbelopsis sp. AD052]|nr:major facilitator superfamily domain-containing protein [Umbelopsis sp. AD052]
MADDSRTNVDNASQTPIEDKNEPEDHRPALSDLPWKYKTIIILSLLTLSVGSHFLSTISKVLKTNVKQNLNINNTQYSVLISCVSVLNTIIPFFAGSFVDRFGPVQATLLVTTAITIGSMQLALSASFDSYGLMISGEIFFGIGSGVISVIEEAILSKWFRNNHLSLIIGAQLCITRMVQFVANVASQPLVAAAHNWAWAYYVSLILCCFSLAMNVLFAYMMWHFGYITWTGKLVRDESYLAERRIKWTAPLYFPLVFWMAPFMQLTISSVWSSFESLSTEYIQFRFSTTSVLAAYKSSISQAVPMVMAPVMGFIIDRWGKRLSFLFLAAIILLISFILLSQTYVNAAIGMTLFSLSLAIGSIMILTSTALTLPRKYIGTGIGLHKTANNIGTTIISVIAGYLQDHAYHDEYNGVMNLYLALTSLSILLVAFWWILDRIKQHGWLEATKAERKKRLTGQDENAMEDTADTTYSDEQLAATGRLLLSKKTYRYCAIYIFFLVVAWAIFFAFALMPVYQHESSDDEGTLSGGG